MTRRLDIPTLFQLAGIPLDASEATLRHELEQRGWRVQVEEPVRDGVRQRSGSGNRYRALAFRTRQAGPATGGHFADYTSQHGPSVEAALRKVVAAVLQRRGS